MSAKMSAAKMSPRQVSSVKMSPEQLESNKMSPKPGDLTKPKKGEVVVSAKDSKNAVRMTNSRSGLPQGTVASLFGNASLPDADDFASMQSRKEVGFAPSIKDGSEHSGSVRSAKPLKVPCNSRVTITAPCCTPKFGLPNFSPDAKAICSGTKNEEECRAFIKSLQKPTSQPSIKKLMLKESTNISHAKAKDNAMQAKQKKKEDKMYKEALKVLRAPDRSLKDCEDFVKAIRKTLAAGRLTIDDVMKTPLERAGFTEAMLQEMLAGPQPDVVFEGMRRTSPGNKSKEESHANIMNKFSGLMGEDGCSLKKKLRELYEAFLLWLWAKLGRKPDTLIKELKKQNEEGSLLSSLSQQVLSKDKDADYGLIKRFTPKKSQSNKSMMSSRQGRNTATTVVSAVGGHDSGMSINSASRGRSDTQVSRSGRRTPRDNSTPGRATPRNPGTPRSVAD